MNRHIKVDGCSRCPFASWTPQESNCELLAPDLTMLPREGGARLPNCPMLAGPVVVTYTTPEHDGRTESVLDTAAKMGAEVERALGNVFAEGAAFGEGFVKNLLDLDKKKDAADGTE